MKGVRLLSLLSVLSILNIVSPSALFLKQRLKRNTDTGVYWDYPHEAIFQQKLDHFNPADDRKWDQRYWITVTHHRKTGPAFLFVNGQHLVNENCGYGFSYQGLAFAKELNAICFSLEHRYYGEIWPTNETMHYLSIAQALEDIANFIKHVTKEFRLRKNTKWVVFGCSYAGTLAAWARLKFPQLIYAAVVSGAPLLVKVDYFEYEQIVEASIKAYSPKCIESITLGIKEIVSLKNFSQLLYLCDHPPEDSAITIKKILFQLMDIFSDAVQNGITTNFTIPTVCDVMNNSKGSELKAFTELRKIYKKFIEDQQSIELESKNPQKEGTNLIWAIEQRSRQADLRFVISNHEIIETHTSREFLGPSFLRNGDRPGKTNATTEFVMSEYPILDTSLVNRRQKNFSCKKWEGRCSEFGFFSSYNTTYLSAAKHLFPIEADIKNSCEQFFGPNFGVKELSEKMNHTNSLYHGLNFNVENVIFIHGSLDPWYKAGIYKKKNDSLFETFFIKGISHCDDSTIDSDIDIPELKSARKQILEILKMWLKGDSKVEHTTVSEAPNESL